MRSLSMSRTKSARPSGEEIEGGEHADPATVPGGEVALEQLAPDLALLALVEVQGRDPQAVVGAPEDEVWRLAVPHPAGDEGHVHAHDGQQHGARAEELDVPELSHHGPVDVVDEPARQGHVPVRPEVADVLVAEGPVEVLGQWNPHEPGAADGQVRVAREVEVEVERTGVEADHRVEERHLRERLRLVLQGVREQQGHEHELLEQAVDDPPPASLEVRPAASSLPSPTCPVNWLYRAMGPLMNDGKKIM